MHWARQAAASEGGVLPLFSLLFLLFLLFFPSVPSPSSPRSTARPSSPRVAAPPQASSPEPTSPASSPRRKFDVSQPYDPAAIKRAYKEDHQRARVPAPPKGVVGTRVEMPAALREFTELKVVQEPENPKVGVYLGPTGKTAGSVYSTQYDVRKKQAIGAPEVSTRGHIGAAAEKVSVVRIHTAGNICFEERVFANTNVLDLIAATVRKLEILHPASYFGCIQKRGDSEIWISPDVLALDLNSSDHLVVVPKQAAPEEIKKAYFAKINKRPATYTVEPDGPTIDVESAPNEGKQFYKQY